LGREGVAEGSVGDGGLLVDEFAADVGLVRQVGDGLGSGQRLNCQVLPLAGWQGFRGTAVGNCPEPSRDGPPAGPGAAATAVEFHYTQTESFVALLRQLGATLLVSTYQANKLLVVRAAGGGLSTLVRTFDRPMGLAADGRRLAVGTRTEVWLLRNAPDIAPRIEPAGHHDACYLPRSCHVTGDIGIHEMAWAGPASSSSVSVA
jgi:Domain of unknown function (DUF4915)